ncbi:MAG: hypothetical protein U1F77_01475 [Kiritimatiellia bacterium]
MKSKTHSVSRSARVRGKGDGVLLLSLPMDDLSAGGATIRL